MSRKKHKQKPRRTGVRPPAGKPPLASGPAKSGAPMQKSPDGSGAEAKAASHAPRGLSAAAPAALVAGVAGVGGVDDIGAAPAPNAVASGPPVTRRWTMAKLFRWSAAALGGLVLAALAYGVYMVIKLQGEIYRPLPATPTAVSIVLPSQPPVSPGLPTLTPFPTPTRDHVRDLPAGRFNVLVLGNDKRPNDPDHFARSDTLLVVSVDTSHRRVGVLTVPRDLIVEIPDYGKNKVNAAYLFGEYYREPGGGPLLSMRTLSKLFNLPIDHYVTVNFDGFREVVDAVGGVEVVVPYELDDYNYPSDDEGDPFGTLHVHFDAGPQHMDGKTALRYARTRHADNDFARSRRQMQIIMALRQRALSLDLLPKVPEVLDGLGGMVETSLPFDQQLGLAQLAFGLDASGIVTASIDNALTTAGYLPDGSEGLLLNWKKAQPVLDAFFGLATPTATPKPRPSATATPTRKATATATPRPSSPRPTRTP